MLYLKTWCANINILQVFTDLHVCFYEVMVWCGVGVRATPEGGQFIFTTWATIWSTREWGYDVRVSQIRIFRVEPLASWPVAGLQQ